MSDRRGYEISQVGGSTVTCGHGKHEMVCRCWIDDFKKSESVEKELIQAKQHVFLQLRDIETLTKQVSDLANTITQLEAQLIAANEALDKCVLIEPDRITNHEAVLEYLQKNEFEQRKLAEILQAKFDDACKRIYELEKRCRQSSSL